MNSLLFFILKKNKIRCGSGMIMRGLSDSPTHGTEEIIPRNPVEISGFLNMCAPA
jgi:hypothetical protein